MVEYSPASWRPASKNGLDEGAEGPSHVSVSTVTQDAFEQIRADQSIFFGDSETYYTYEGSE